MRGQGRSRSRAVLRRWLSRGTVVRERWRVKLWLRRASVGLEDGYCRL